MNENAFSVIAVILAIVASFLSLSALNCVIFDFLMIFCVPFGSGKGKKCYSFLSEKQKILFLTYSITDRTSSALLFCAKFNWLIFWRTVLRDFFGLRSEKEKKDIMDSLKGSERYAKMLFMETSRFTALQNLEKGKKKWKKTIKSSQKKTTTTQQSEEKRK